jgi:hypothetical protein
MPGLFLVNALDASRSLGPRLAQATAESVEHFLITEYLRKQGGGFNYNPSIFATGDIFRGRINTQEAIKFCESYGSPAGRKQNSKIVKLVGPHAELNQSIVHKIGFLAIRIARYKGYTIYLGLKAPYVRVRDRHGFLVIPGFRKTYLPSDEQIAFPIALAHFQIARDDLSGIDTEYLYAGPGHGGVDRVFRAIYGEETELLSQDAIDDLLSVYVSGVIRVLERGLGLNKANLAGYRIVDPGQGNLF